MFKMFKRMSKKAQTSTNNFVKMIVGIFIGLILLGALAGSVFDVGTTINQTGAPDWLADNWNTFVGIIMLLALLGLGGLYKFKGAR